MPEAPTATFHLDLRISFSKSATDWAWEEMQWYKGGIQIFTSKEEVVPTFFIIEGGYPDNWESPLRLAKSPISGLAYLDFQDRGLDHLRKWWPRAEWTTQIRYKEPTSRFLNDLFYIPLPDSIARRTSTIKYRAPKTDRNSRRFRPHLGDIYLGDSQIRTVTHITAGANDRDTKVTFCPGRLSTSTATRTTTLGAFRDWIRRTEAQLEV